MLDGMINENAKRTEIADGKRAAMLAATPANRRF
jgi:hypothetical protein